MPKTQTMSQFNFTFNIEAEQNDSVLVRILMTITRRRMRLLSFCSYEKGGDLLHITFVIEETSENAGKFSTRLEKQIDILSVTFFEKQKNNQYAKQNLQGTL